MDAGEAATQVPSLARTRQAVRGAGWAPHWQQRAKGAHARQRSLSLLTVAQSAVGGHTLVMPGATHVEGGAGQRRINVARAIMQHPGAHSLAARARCRAVLGKGAAMPHSLSVRQSQASEGELKSRGNAAITRPVPAWAWDGGRGWVRRQAAINGHAHALINAARAGWQAAGNNAGGLLAPTQQNAGGAVRRPPLPVRPTRQSVHPLKMKRSTASEAGQGKTDRLRPQPIGGRCSLASEMRVFAARGGATHGGAARQTLRPSWGPRARCCRCPATPRPPRACRRPAARGARRAPGPWPATAP